MALTAFAAALHTRFGAERVHSNMPLAPFTTFKVGGPAEWLLEARNSDEILAALRAAGLPANLLSSVTGEEIR